MIIVHLHNELNCHIFVKISIENMRNMLCTEQKDDNILYEFNDWDFFRFRFKRDHFYFNHM